MPKLQTGHLHAKRIRKIYLESINGINKQKQNIFSLNTKLQFETQNTGLTSNNQSTDINKILE
jgi:hypothetical protein